MMIKICVFFLYAISLYFMRLTDLFYAHLISTVYKWNLFKRLFNQSLNYVPIYKDSLQYAIKVCNQNFRESDRKAKLTNWMPTLNCNRDLIFTP